MKASQDNLLKLIARHLELSGLPLAHQALMEEAHLPDSATALPSLVSLVDEWVDLKAMLVVPDSSGTADSFDAIDLDSILGDAKSEDAVAESKHHSESAASAALCCTFVGDEALVWGEANKTLHGCDLEGANEWSYSLPDSGTFGGILCLASDGSRIILGTMSGVVQVLNAQTRLLEQSLPMIHKKYVHRVLLKDQWLITASHDCSVGVWRRETKDGESVEYLLVGQKYFKAIPEGLGIGGIDGDLLYVGVRDTNLLCTYSLKTDDLDHVKVNLSPFLDEHVTFNILDLSVCSKNGRVIALASDRDRVFVYWVDGDRCKLLSTLTGMNSDGLSVSRVQFSPEGRFLYASSSEGSVCVFDLLTSRLVRRLKGHKSVVRDLVAHPTKELLASVSFDKTCNLWTSEML